MLEPVGITESLPTLPPRPPPSCCLDPIPFYWRHWGMSLEVSHFNAWCYHGWGCLVSKTKGQRDYYYKIELRVLVGWLFWDLIVWLPYTVNGNVEIIIVETWSRSCCALIMVELKIPRRYLDLLNHATFYEGVEFFFGFTNKFFRVTCNDLNHVTMEGLGSKYLIIQLEFAKDV